MNRPSTALWRIIALFVLLATGFNLVTRPYEAPDELLHYEFVEYLLAERTLPVMQTDGTLSEYHQPPVYYLLTTAAVFWVQEPAIELDRNPFWTSYGYGIFHNDNKAQFLPPSPTQAAEGSPLVIHVGRALSTILGVLSVWVTWLTARMIWPDRPRLPLVAATLVALNPMYLFLSGAINNDALVTFLGVLTLYLAFRAIDDGFSWRTTGWILLVWCAATLTKLTGLMVAAGWGIALLWVVWDKRSWSLLFSRGIALSVGFLALCGWWFYRNWVLYRELTAVNVMLEQWGIRTEAQQSLSLLLTDLGFAWTNYWGRFAYGQIVMPRPFYELYTLISLIALIGLVWGAVRWWGDGRKLTPQTGRWFVITLMWLAIFIAFFNFMYRNPSGANGRYLYPALSGFAILLTQGLAVLIDRLEFSDAVRKWGLLGFQTVLAGWAVWSVGAVAWTYAPPAGEIAYAVEQPWRWGEMQLIGSTVEQTTVTEDDLLWVTLCWEGNAPIDHNFPVSVILTDQEQIKYANRNSHPGLGNWPTTLWQPGEPFCDRYRLPIDPIQLGRIDQPRMADVVVGVIGDNAAGFPVATHAEGYTTEIVTIGQVKVVPTTISAPPDPAQRVDIIFDQGLTLYGIEWPDSAAAGETLSIKLWWRLGQPLSADYKFFIHLLDEQGEIVSQIDADPAYPSTFWAADERLLTEYELAIPAELAPSDLTIRVGLYDPISGVRLPLAGGSADAADFAGLSVR